MTIAGYDAQKAISNLTIQHTVADVLVGVVPERVADIVVEEEEEEGGRFQMKTAVGSVILRYTVTVHDPLLTAEMMRAHLLQAVSDGKMDTSLRFNAARFGATALNSGVFGEPRVSSETSHDSDSSAQFAGWEIALIAIGAALALGLLACVLYHHRRKQAKTYQVACADQGPEAA